MKACGYKIIRLIIIISFFYAGKTTGQSVSIDSLKACTGDSVFVSVNFTDLDSLGAITLYISFDTAVLEFDTILNLNAQTPGTIYNTIHQAVSMVGIAWYSSNGIPASIGTGKYLDIAFLYKGGQTSVSPEPGSEIADIHGNIINTGFSYGSVSQGHVPFILQQPVDTMTIQGGNACFTVLDSNATSYKWYYSSDSGMSWKAANIPPFQHYLSNELLIQNVADSLQNFAFSCELKNQCAVFTDPAFLWIDSLSGAVGTATEMYKLNLFPNPCTEYLNLKGTFPFIPREIQLKLLSQDGRVLQVFSEKGKGYTYYYRINVKDLEDGMYFLQMVLYSREGKQIINRKISVIK